MHRLLKSNLNEECCNAWTNLTNELAYIVHFGNIKKGHLEIQPRHQKVKSYHIGDSDM